MASTVSTDLNFDPVVWHDHITAYFDDKLVYGAFAYRPSEKLKEEKAGLTISFPFYGKIGGAEEPAENDVLTVDNLTDDSFTATTFEAAKAIGFKKRAFMASGDGKNGLLQEGQTQLARVMAEKVDQKLNEEINLATSHTDVTGTVGNMSITALNRARILAFGDKMGDAEVCFMHSNQYLDLVNNQDQGFLKMDANDPAMLIEGFMGRFLGMAIVVVDSVTSTGTGAATEYACHFHKMNSYGIMDKDLMSFDDDKDILAREVLVTANQWYAVKSFHAKVAADDLRTGRLRTTSSANA